MTLSSPFADLLRPKTLEDILGQQHLLDPKGAIGRQLAQNNVSSMILWGPPGCGKTSLARLLAARVGLFFEALSAVGSGVADLRKVFESAKARRAQGQGTVLFLDEIHRYSKSQQDVLLPFMEDGTVVVVGATTENPSFSLNSALLSRARVFVLRRLEIPDLSLLLDRAEAYKGQALPLTPSARSALLAMADGDGRYLLGLVQDLWTTGEVLDEAGLLEALQKRAPLHDASGDGHYEALSAFHKSLRASDVDAALYWGARLIKGGEPPETLFRRLQCVASEDVGLADPAAMVQVLTAWQAFERLGWPEGRMPLSQAICYVATAPKSNAAYLAFHRALALAEDTGSVKPPLHAMNAPTRLMKELGHKQGYVYDHDTPEGFSGLSYFPPEVERQTFYAPVARGFERDIGRRLEYWTRLRGERERR